MVRIKIPLQEFYICAISQSFNTPSHWPVPFTKLLQSICVIPLYYKTTAMWLLRNIHNVWIKNDRRIVFSFAIEFNAINRMEKYIMIINTIYLTVKRYKSQIQTRAWREWRFLMVLKMLKIDLIQQRTFLFVNRIFSIFTKEF